MSLDVDRIPSRAPGPQARIDRSHPLAQGLAAYMTPLCGTRQYLDHATGIVRPSNMLFRPSVAVPSPYGLANQSDQEATDSIAAFTAPIPATSAVSTLTIAARVAADAVGGYTRPIVRVGSASAGNQTHIVFRDAPGSQVMVSNWGNDLAGPTPAAGEWRQIGTTYSAAANEIYVDGNRYTSGTAAAYAGNNTIGPCAIPYSWYQLIAVWFRRLTAADFAALCNDPFCMLREEG